MKKNWSVWGTGIFNKLTPGSSKKLAPYHIECLPHGEEDVRGPPVDPPVDDQEGQEGREQGEEAGQDGGVPHGAVDGAPPVEGTPSGGGRRRERSGGTHGGAERRDQTFFPILL